MRFANHALLSALAALLLAVTAGCTVRPLMATPPDTPGESTAAALSSVSVAPVGTRYGQEARNHLIFLLHGGAARPETPRYTLDLAVSRSVGAAARIQSGGLDEPTAGTVTLTGRYSLVEAETDRVIGTGRRQVSAAFDRPRQEFAVLRAQRDAEDRAARELAELIRLSIGQDLARLGAP